MPPLAIILLVLAFVLLLLAAFGITHPRFNFGWAGLACYILSEMMRFHP